MAVSTYKHGVTWRDVPTSIIAPVTADSGIPVAVGKAPSFLSSSPAPANVPRIYFSYEEAVAEMGFSYDFNTYTLCEMMYTYFVLFNVGPIILSNVLDESDTKYQKAPVVDSPFTLVAGRIDTGVADVILSKVVVKDTTGATTYVVDKDYVAAYDEDGTLTISVIPGSAIGQTAAIKVSYTQVDPSKVTKQDVIGGVDPVTGMGTGLEVIEDVFPKLAVIPGILLAPGYNQDPEVAAVLTSKADNINGCFRCTTFVDVDSTTVIKPMDVNAWKNTNNYVTNREYVGFPRLGIDDKQMWASTQLAALAEKTDQANGDVPVETPSNKNVKCTKLLAGPLDAPIEITFGKSMADYLNGIGVVTCINWIGGWKAWGSNMGIYPSSTDPKDRWLPVRRMTDFVGNTTVLTIYQFVDRPGNRRLIDSIIDSLNLWLNTLVASGQSLGARVEFIHSENSDTELLNGHYKFHIYEAFPTPAEWIEFLLEFDVSYLETLFTPITAQTPIAA